MPKYLLVARDAGDWTNLDVSPEEIQGILERYMTWSAGLAERGKLVSGEKLKDGEGRVLRGTGSQLKVSDGPHSESKEVVGGVWILDAADYDEAVELCRDNPHLHFGTLELREIEAME